MFKDYYILSYNNYLEGLTGILIENKEKYFNIKEKI